MTGECAVINTMLPNNLILVEDTLVYTLGRADAGSFRELCRIDMYIWVPTPDEVNPLDSILFPLPPCVSFGTAQPTLSS